MGFRITDQSKGLLAMLKTKKFAILNPTPDPTIFAPFFIQPWKIIPMIAPQCMFA